MARAGAALLAAALLALPALGGCRGQPDDPQARVRALIARAAAAAEARDLGTLRELISPDYRDTHGHDRRALEALLRLQFLRHDTLHLFTRVQSLELPQPDRAEAVVLVAMAGMPIASELELPALRADLHRFELEFALEDGTWRLQRAGWRRAGLGELTGP